MHAILDKKFILKTSIQRMYNGSKMN